MKFPFVIAALNSRTIVFGISFFVKISLREKCLYSEIVWCVFSRPYSVRMQESTVQKSPEYGHFLQIVYDYFYLKKASISLPTDINFH